MSYAPDYTPGTSFADDETNNVAGRSLVKTDRLDSELADISASINALNDNQKAFQRDDGKLADSLVEPYALAEQTKALIATSGSNPRGTWQTNTDYAYKDVIQRNNIAQICLQEHNSGSSFTQSFWLPISGDGTSSANAAAAAASASAAATSQTAASASATAAAGSATSASTSATNASASATNASNSAASAATSEENAGNSATEAAASAAAAAASAGSINAPLNLSSDPSLESSSPDLSVSAEWANALISKLLSGITFDWPGQTAPPGAMELPLVPTNVSRTTYSKWFQRFGTQFGSGDGSTTFGMPYCPQNQVFVQANGNVGTTTTGQMPSHSHQVQLYSSGGTGNIGSASSGTPAGTNGTGAAGSGSNNLPAGVRMLKCIWL